jgi:hypothetical protein
MMGVSSPYGILKNPDVLIGWSAPSAIGTPPSSFGLAFRIEHQLATAGMGFGGQAGAELTDCLVVLNSRSVGLIALPCA